MRRIFKNERNPSKLGNEIQKKQQQESDDEEYENTHVIQDIHRTMTMNQKSPAAGKNEQFHETSEAAQLRQRIQSMPLGQAEQLKRNWA
uniref:Uncharacterized protein n=1 Tax=Ditylenchus dipsaci TaxID=166011 RepID=A0A915CQ85_9BILA